MPRTTVATRFQEAVTLDAFRTYVAEFISTFFLVFAVVGSTMSSRKLMPDTASDPSSLVAVAISNAFALSWAVYVSANVSGGHANPAVTFAMVVGGHTRVTTALFYWASQLLASVLACLVLKLAIVGLHIPNYTVTEEMTGFGASVLEGFASFALVYTVFAARRGLSFALGPLAIGLVAGAGVLATGPFSGGAINPACAFGSSVVAGTFKNQAAYWIGPLFGAAVAGLLYDNIVCPPQAQAQAQAQIMPEVQV